MEAKKCDRCGDYYDPYDRHDGDEVNVCDLFEEKDLCPSCHVKLNVWYKEGKNDT